MKSAASKIKDLAIDIAVILCLIMGAIAIATHGLKLNYHPCFRKYGIEHGAMVSRQGAVELSSHPPSRHVRSASLGQYASLSFVVSR